MSGVNKISLFVLCASFLGGVVMSYRGMNVTSIIAIDVAVRNGVVQLSGTPHFRILCIPAERVSLGARPDRHCGRAFVAR
jgi:hypothetical protein